MNSIIKYKLSKLKKLLMVCSVSITLLNSCTSTVRFSSNNSNNEKSSSSTKKYTAKPEISKTGLTKKQKLIIEEAEKWIGTPYCWGGESFDCADCSGFVMTVFSKNGIELPRTAQQQFDFGKKVSIDNAKAGDLIFFRKSNKITHVGIYVGNRTFIHASSSKGVIIQDLDEFGSSPTFAGCREIL